MFENVKADLQRLSPSGRSTLRSLVAGLLSQGFQAILVYRFFNWCLRKKIPGQPLRFFCERFIEITTGISIPAACTIGKGLRIHHFGGIIFHPTTRLGENCTLYHGVTIGDRGGSGGAAHVGNNVLIGAGAKLIGEVTIGDDSIIGANTVVTRDVPHAAVAVGSTCRYRQRKPEELKPTVAPAAEMPLPRVMDLRGTYKGGGGPDKTVLNSAALHDPAKVYVLVTYLRNPKDHEFQIAERARALGINYVDVFDGRMLDLGCLKRLRALIRAHGVTLVHAHDDKTLLYAWLLKLITPGVRVMYTCHSHGAHRREDFPGSASYLRFRLRQQIQIFLMKRYRGRILTVSEETKRRLVSNGLQKDQVSVLHNGIDIGFWSRQKAKPDFRRELEIPAEGFLVGTVARITMEKDLPTFYRVAEKVATRVPQVRFAIVGDGYGDELEKARDQVRELGLERLIHFTGHRNDLLNIYASFDLFLMTSLTEGLPNTMLEAMALGLPVVSTAVGGVPELVEPGVTGFLAEVGDIEGLSGQVITLLLNPELRVSFGNAARRRIEERFAFDHRVRTMEEIYCRFSGLAVT